MADFTEVVVGRLGRAHGLKGAVGVDVRTDEPGRRFVKGARFHLDDGRELEVVEVTWQRGRLLLRFVGHDDRTSAEALNGQDLLAKVPADELPSGSDEYFDRQLVGLAVLRSDGTRAGTVIGVSHMPAQDLLRVDVDGSERLVPFVSALVPDVDLEAGTITLAPVEGLLEDLE